MPAGPINLVPWGFGNLFGLKGDEGLLKMLEDNIQCVLPVLEIFAGPNAQEVVSDTVTPANPGVWAFSNLAVPSGEAWLVRGLGFSADGLTGAELFRGHIAIAGPRGQSLRQVTATEASNAADNIGRTWNVGGELNQGAFFMYPGEYPYLRAISVVVGAGFDVGCTLSILRFRF